MKEPDLERLLRAAAAASAASAEADAGEMPYGFDTRVLANWRSDRGTEWRGFARVFRRIALSAVVVTICAGSAAWWQLRENDDLDYPTTNAYAIADTAIEAGAWQ